MGIYKIRPHCGARLDSFARELAEAQRAGAGR